MSRHFSSDDVPVSQQWQQRTLKRMTWDSRAKDHATQQGTPWWQYERPACCQETWDAWTHTWIETTGTHTHTHAHTPDFWAKAQKIFNKVFLKQTWVRCYLYATCQHSTKDTVNNRMYVWWLTLPPIHWYHNWMIRSHPDKERSITNHSQQTVCFIRTTLSPSIADTGIYLLCLLQQDYTLLRGENMNIIDLLGTMVNILFLLRGKCCSTLLLYSPNAVLLYRGRHCSHTWWVMDSSNCINLTFLMADQSAVPSGLSDLNEIPVIIHEASWVEVCIMFTVGSLHCNSHREEPHCAVSPESGFSECKC